MKISKLVFYLMLFALIISIGVQFSYIRTVKAQNPDLSPYLYSVNGPHTQCLIIPNTTRYCMADDGPFWSLKGAVYISMISTQVTGVTSLNGQTGALTTATAQIKYFDLLNKPTGLNCTSATHANSGLNCPTGTLSLLP
jgi:hypothetical protein